MKLPLLKHTKKRAFKESEIISIPYYLAFWLSPALLISCTLVSIFAITFCENSLNTYSGSLNYERIGCFCIPEMKSSSPIGHLAILFPFKVIEFHYSSAHSLIEEIWLMKSKEYYNINNCSLIASYLQTL